MNRLTKFSILVFIISSGIFGYFQYTEGKILDTGAPIISFETDEIEISVKDPTEVLLQGVKARDRKDGDVTDSLVVEGVSNFYDKGSRIVTYAAFDSDLNVTRKTRTLTYKDYYSPEFELRSPLSFSKGTSTDSLLKAISATDCLDGNLTDFVKIIPLETVYTSKVGDYRVRYEVANSAGDVSSFEAQVNIYDNTEVRGPQVVLPQYLVYINHGSSFNPKSYPKSVLIGSKEYEIVEGWGNYGNPDRNPEDVIKVGIDQIQIENEVDTGKAGIYKVKYSMTNAAAYEKDRYTGTVTMYVIVREEARE